MILLLLASALYVPPPVLPAIKLPALMILQFNNGGGAGGSPYTISTSGITSSPSGLGASAQVDSGDKSHQGSTCYGIGCTINQANPSGNQIATVGIFENATSVAIGAGNGLDALSIILEDNLDHDESNAGIAGIVISNAKLTTQATSQLDGIAIVTDQQNGTADNNIGAVVSPSIEGGTNNFGIQGFVATIGVGGGTAAAAQAFEIATQILGGTVSLIQQINMEDLTALTGIPDAHGINIGVIAGSNSSTGVEIGDVMGVVDAFALHTHAGLNFFGDSVSLAAGTTSAYSLYCPAGVALTSPINGEMYCDANGPYFFNGANYSPLSAGLGVSVQGGVGALQASTSYMPAIGGIVTAFVTTEAAAQIMTPRTGVIKNFVCLTSSGQPSTGSLTINLRKNGSTALSLFIAASSAAGKFISAPGTVNVIGGVTADLLDFQIVNAAPLAPSAAVNGCSWELK